MCWLADHGATVSIPFGHSPDYDLVADFGAGLLRVQVKTAGHSRRGRWEVRLCTMGGNQSWSVLVKRLDPSRCDLVFAHVGDGRRWYIPSVVIDGGRAVLLGGPKYSEYEVEPGSPLPSRITASEPRSG